MIKTIKLAFLGLISMAFVGSAYADMTFVSWGGAYTASQQKAYIDTWSKGSGVTVETETLIEPLSGVTLLIVGGPTALSVVDYVVAASEISFVSRPSSFRVCCPHPSRIKTLNIKIMKGFRISIATPS